MKFCRVLTYPPYINLIFAIVLKGTFVSLNLTPYKFDVILTVHRR